MDRISKSLPFTPSLSSESDLCRPSARNMGTTFVQPHQTHPPHHLMSCASPPSFSTTRCLPPIQKLQAPSTYPTYSNKVDRMLPRDFSRDIVDFPVTPCGDQYPQFQHQQWLDQPCGRNDYTRVTPSLPGSCLQAGEYPLPIHSREPESKRCRLGSETWPTSLEVGAWEIDALAVAKSKHASKQSSSQHGFLADRPACSWATLENPSTESPPLI